MKIKLFCIKDNKLDGYLPPFHQPSTEMAVRLFTDTVNQHDHPMAKHPEDYTLFELATFEDTHAVISVYQSPKPLGNGLDFLDPSMKGRLLTDDQIDWIIENMKNEVK